MESRLRRNIGIVSLNQAVNIFTPLLLTPVMISGLGIADFGVWMFAISACTFLAIFVDYGFNITTTRSVSLNRDKQLDLRNIVWNTIYAKIIISSILLIVLNFFLIEFAKVRDHIAIFNCAFIFLTVQSLMPIWYFQGIENVKFFVCANIAGKILLVIGVFYCLHAYSNLLAVAIVYCASVLFVLVLQTAYMILFFKITPVVVDISDIYKAVKDGFIIFVSSLSVLIYSSSPIFFIGIFLSYEAVGIYAIGEKIYLGIKSLYQPISSAVFPVMSKMLKDDFESAISLLRSISLLSIFIMSIISSALLLLAPHIVTLFAGSPHKQSIEVLKILSFVPVLAILSNLAGLQLLVNLGKQKYTSIILMIGAIVGCFLLVMFIPVYGTAGAAYSVFVVELLVAVLTVGFAYRVIKKRDLWS